MPKKILVVDDEKGFTETLTDLFARRGYVVFVAYDGEEALARLRAEAPDLVILDIVMPKLDGLKVAAAMRSDRFFREIPVVMLTARTDMQDTKEALELGAAAYVAKPFKLESLLGIVDGLIGRSELKTA